jgi:hypothetical protein
MRLERAVDDMNDVCHAPAGLSQDVCALDKAANRLEMRSVAASMVGECFIVCDTIACTIASVFSSDGQARVAGSFSGGCFASAP